MFSAFPVPTRKNIMSREELISQILETKDTSEIAERLKSVEDMLKLLLSVVVVQQKDACEALGISPETVRNKVLRGETEVLSADGSRLNYITLENVNGLKKRKPTKRK